jgi:hypothetical protein
MLMTFFNDAKRSRMLPKRVCRPPCKKDCNRVESYAHLNETAIYAAVPFNYPTTIAMLFTIQKKLKQTLQWLLHM